MAQFNSTTFGAISGRHGSAVAATTKDGKSILKIFRAPSNPNTQKQQVQRTKFGFVNSELGCLRNLFKITFRSNTGINQGVSYAMKNALTGEFPDFAIDFTKLTFSTGNVYAAVQTSANKTVGTKVKTDWNFTLMTNSKADDAVHLIFFNETTRMALIEQNIAERKDMSVEVELPNIWVGESIHCWLYFSDNSNFTDSNSQFIGTLQL
ncbi:MAG: hypothetical protein GZ091_14395 [Paludibacter sp.]|nr:hypothetical protein [Paludibacter sp.]